MSLVIVVNKIIKALRVPAYPVCVSVNVSATLSMFDLEIKKRKSTLMTFFFYCYSNMIKIWDTSVALHHIEYV